MHPHINPAEKPVRRFVRMPVPLVRRKQITADSFGVACFTVLADDWKSGSERGRRSDP